MVPAEVHQARLDRFVRNWWVTFWYVTAIVVLGGLVEAFGIA